MIAWHYTVGQSAQRIIADGSILAKPAAWFSVRPTVEPSCCRTVMRGDRPHRLSIGETGRMFAGWLRFGVPVTELLPAEEVRQRCGIGRHAWRQREATARAQGSDVRQWFASFEPVALERCTVERLEGHPDRGTWQAIPDPRAWRSAMLDAAVAAAWARAHCGES